MKFTQIRPNIFQWTDTCNSYVVRDGASAILIDLGDGSVLDGLQSLGVTRLDWVLFTHHHREQCQGAGKLVPWRAQGTKVASSVVERPFFQSPIKYRRIRPRLYNPYSVYGTSYLRPPVESVEIDHAFSKMDQLTWRGHEFWCIETPGNSPGHMAYLLKDGDDWLAFSGDVMCDGARMHTWYDTEWDYGVGGGIYEIAKSAAQIAAYSPAVLLPSHGPTILQPREQLDAYVKKLKRLSKLYVRGYSFLTFDSCDQDTTSRPSSVPHLWQVTPHVYKFRGPNCWVNFIMILADNGHALLIDCGLFEHDFLDASIERMKERLGLKKIDAIFITHMHGDHAMDASHVREKYGAELWTMDNVAEKLENPWSYDYCALLAFYTNDKIEYGPIKIDRVFRDGETFTWQGHTLSVDWMPGQTKYHCCLHGEIDGRRIAFTGDNIFASTTDPEQGGTEAVCSRNDCLLEEGYIYAADYLHTINPDLIVGGHCWVMDQPQQLIERYRKRATELRAAFEDLSAEAEYQYMFDPYWIKAEPYRLMLEPGGNGDLKILARNFSERPIRYRVAIHCPAGLVAEPAFVEGTVPAKTTNVFTTSLKAVPDANAGTHIVALDITREGVRHGDLFDFIVQVGPIDKARDDS